MDAAMPKPINNDIPVAVLREALVLDPTAASGVRWRCRAGLSLQSNARLAGKSRMVAQQRLLAHQPDVRRQSTPASGASHCLRARAWAIGRPMDSTTPMASQTNHHDSIGRAPKERLL
jgi:hypothetical protein